MTEYPARVYEANSGHPVKVSASVTDAGLLLRAEDGRQLELPFDSIEIKNGMVSQDRLVISCTQTNQTIVSDAPELLKELSNCPNAEHLRKQIGNLRSNRTVNSIKGGAGTIAIFAVILGFLWFVYIGFTFEDKKRAPEHSRQSEGTTDRTMTDEEWYLNELEQILPAVWNPPKLPTAKVVVVVFQVDSKGHVSGLKCSRSSGNEALDAAALKGVEDAQPLPPIPYRMGRNSLDIEYTFVYNPKSHTK